MTTLDLRPLTEPQRLAAINQHVAEHVAGWTMSPHHVPVRGWPPGDKQKPWLVSSLPPFATSADAVLPLLEKF